MEEAYGQDLRNRVIEAGLTGPNVRQAAVRFGEAFGTAIGWMRRLCEHGERSAYRQGRPRASKLDPHREFVLSRLEAEPDLTIQKMQKLLYKECGVRASVSTIWSFLYWADHTFKNKSIHSSEQERPDFRKERESWFEVQLYLDPNKLVFVDETWASTNVAPLLCLGAAQRASARGRTTRSL